MTQAEWEGAEAASVLIKLVFYPLNVRDFLDRAETVYPDRLGILDEPDQPAPSLGEGYRRRWGWRRRWQHAHGAAG